MRGMWLCVVLCAAALSFESATAAGTSSGEDQDVAKKLSNPVSDMVSVCHPRPIRRSARDTSESIANWLAPKESDTWTIPIILNVSKVTRFGPFPFSIAGGGGAYIAKPADGPEWQLRTTFTLVLPGKK